MTKKVWQSILFCHAFAFHFSLKRKLSMRKQIYFLVCAFLLCSSAFGQNSVSQPNANTQQDTTLMKQVDVDDVVITSDRQLRPLRNVPVITHVVRSEEIQRINPRSMVDVIEFILPGIEYSLHGSQERLSIQGLSADYVLFLVDGERITNEGSSSVDLNRIDPSNIERIEMVRGSASALYGSNAIGGVINIITRTAKRPVEASYTGLYDSQMVQRHNGYFGIKQKGFQSTTTGGWSFQDTYGLRIKDARDTAVVPGNEIWNVGQKLGYSTPTGRFKVEANGTYNNREQFGEVNGFYNHYKFYKVGGNAQYRFNDAYNLDIAYNHDGYARDEVMELGPRKGRRPVYSYLTHTSRVQFNAKPWGEGLPTFNLGFESVNERTKGDRFKDQSKYRSASTYTGYLQTEWRALEKLTLTGGVRYDLHSQFKGYATPRIAAMWREKYFAVRGSFSTGFRSPTLKELFMEWTHAGGGGFVIQGNENLKPETSNMFALSPEFTYGKFNISSTFYYNVFRNRIEQEWLEIGGTRYLKYLNYSGSSWIAGVQTILVYHVLSNLDLRLNHSYVHDIYEVKDKNGDAFDVSQVRPHTATAAVNYRYTFKKDFAVGTDVSGRFYGSLHAAFRTSDTDLLYAYRDYPSYYTLRASLYASWKNHATLTFGCENLLDYVAEQVSVVTSLSPGRSFYVALSLRY